MITSNYHTGVSLAKCLTGKGGAFQGDLVLIKLGEDLSVYLIADGSLSEGVGFNCLRFG